MRHVIKAALLLVALASVGTPAVAGVYTDDMSKCLVKSTNADDKATLMLWVFSALSSHPAVQKYAKMTEDDRLSFARKASELMQRLLTVDCRAETVAALKYEGPSSLEASFNVLGQVAMRGLMSDPSVAGELAELNTYLDKTKWNALMKEAGLPEIGGPASASKP